MRGYPMSILDWFRTNDYPTTATVLELIAQERSHNRKRWGVQVMPSGTKVHGDMENEINAKLANARREQDGTVTWRSVLVEEVAEACNSEGKHLEEELVQVAAVACAWIEAIRDGRAK